MDTVNTLESDVPKAIRVFEELRRHGAWLPAILKMEVAGAESISAG